MEEETKQCTGCKVIKPFSQFHRDRTTNDGRSQRCALCKNNSKRGIKPRRKSQAQSITRLRGRLAPVEVLSDEDAIHNAIAILIERHRTEFDILVFKEQQTLERPSLPDYPAFKRRYSEAS